METLLFPEAEVTRSLSSNLLKGPFTKVLNNEKRIIDVNSLMEKRIDELGKGVKIVSKDKFVNGFAKNISVIDVESFQSDEVEMTNNIIKNNESADAILNQAKEEANGILEQAKVDAEKIIQESKALAIQDAQQAKDQASKEGYNIGYQQAMQEVEKTKQQLQQQKASLNAEFDQLVDQLEPQFVETITNIYEHIFHVDLSSYRDILIYLISSTMNRVEGSRNFMIHISKEDYPYVSMHRKQLGIETTVSSRTVELVEDISLEKGQCLIETDNGIFDCGLGTQMEELRKTLVLLSYEAQVK